MILTHMPLNANGKVARSALPLPQALNFKGGTGKMKNASSDTGADILAEMQNTRFWLGVDEAVRRLFFFGGTSRLIVQLRLSEYLQKLWCDTGPRPPSPPLSLSQLLK